MYFFYFYFDEFPTGPWRSTKTGT